MVVRKLTAQAQRVQLLTRYYVNKWHYDGSKWAERVWYGERKNASASVASVPFMITRTMRAQLEQAGFPPHEISSLVPQVAHQVLADKLTYAQFVAHQKQEVAELAARAAEALEREAKEQDQAQAAAHDLVLVNDAEEEDATAHTSAPRATSQVAIVPQPEPEKSERV